MTCNFQMSPLGKLLLLAREQVLFNCSELHTLRSVLLTRPLLSNENSIKNNQSNHISHPLPLSISFLVPKSRVKFRLQRDALPQYEECTFCDHEPIKIFFRCMMEMNGLYKYSYEQNINIL
jgi:hypothetical protein